MPEVMWSREQEHQPVQGRWWQRRAQRRVRDALDAERCAQLARAFTRCCFSVGLSEDTMSAAGIPGSGVPRVTSVVLGAREGHHRLMVRPLPGQLMTDFQGHHERFAAALGVRQVRFTHRHGQIRVELLPVDPLAARVDQPALVLPESPAALDFGQLERGRRLRLDLAGMAHTIVQGQTRSGKSRFVYGILSQLCARPDVLICGSDVTGLLLRPFEGTRHDALMATGSRDPGRHAAALEDLVAIMDSRIDAMPVDLDVYPCDAEAPYHLVVIEEMPGLLKAASSWDQRHGLKAGQRVRDRIVAAYGRLVAEGAKAGIRLLMITQRADADILGGFERAQAPWRVSFRVDTPSAVTMLHPAAPEHLVEAHLLEAPGIALVSGPELPVTRMRSAHMGSYGDFRALVQRRSGPRLSIAS